MYWTTYREFFCDTCGEGFACPLQGRIEWLRENDGTCRNFQIVHDTPECRFPSTCNVFSQPLNDFLGPDGMARLLCQIGACHGKGAIEEHVEIVRRLHLPNYEEARNYMTREEKERFMASLSPCQFTQRFLLLIRIRNEQPMIW